MVKDFSVENPKLHARYVRYAQEELALLEEMISQLESLSRVNPSILAGKIHEERAELIKNDAAYREAAWRILANDLLEDTDKYHRDAIEDDQKSR